MPKPFQYPTPRRAKVELPRVQPPTQQPEESEPVGLVQGMRPMSKEEARVARALESLGVTYQYQVWVGGGRRVRGGQVLDFLVFTPFEQPVQVYGEYWHTGSLGADDRWNEIVIQEAYGVPVVALWGADLQTQAMATATVKTALRL